MNKTNFIFQYPIERNGYFLMSVDSFVEYSINFINFQQTLRTSGIHFRPTSTGKFIILQYAR